MYYIYCFWDDGRKAYLTSIGNENPLAGIGHQIMHDGSVPSGAGTTPTKEDAQKIIDYLAEDPHMKPHFMELVGE